MKKENFNKISIPDEKFSERFPRNCGKFQRNFEKTTFINFFRTQFEEIPENFPNKFREKIFRNITDEYFEYFWETLQ